VRIKRWRSAGVSLDILNLGTRWRWVVSLTYRPLYPREIVPGTLRIGSWIGPRACVEEKKFCPCRDSKPGRPSRIPSIPTEPSCLLLYNILMAINSSCTYRCQAPSVDHIGQDPLAQTSVRRGINTFYPSMAPVALPPLTAQYCGLLWQRVKQER
jgi:hypothetical protein